MSASPNVQLSPHSCIGSAVVYIGQESACAYVDYANTEVHVWLMLVLCPDRTKKSIFPSGVWACLVPRPENVARSGHKTRFMCAE